MPAPSAAPNVAMFLVAMRSSVSPLETVKPR
jgi:hypothetical protein